MALVEGDRRAAFCQYMHKPRRCEHVQRQLGRFVQPCSYPRYAPRMICDDLTASSKTRCYRLGRAKITPTRNATPSACKGACRVHLPMTSSGMPGELSMAAPALTVSAMADMSRMIPGASGRRVVSTCLLSKAAAPLSLSSNSPIRGAFCLRPGRGWRS